MATVQIRMDDEVKKAGEEVLKELGFSMSRAVEVFIRQTIRERKIPFAISLNQEDFYNPANQAHLRKAIAQLEAGKGVEIEVTRFKAAS